jgi:hypothetical protein
MKPTPKKPRTIIAHVAGSGTADANLTSPWPRLSNIAPSVKNACAQMVIENGLVSDTTPVWSVAKLWSGFVPALVKVPSEVPGVSNAVLAPWRFSGSSNQFRMMFEPAAFTQVPEPVRLKLLTGAEKLVSLTATVASLDAPALLMIDKDEVLMRSWPGLAGVPVENWIEPLTTTPLSVVFASWMVPTAGFKSPTPLSVTDKLLPLTSAEIINTACAGGETAAIRPAAAKPDRKKRDGAFIPNSPQKISSLLVHSNPAQISIQDKSSMKL